MRHALFIADAGPTVGGGHVMRCLTLARALEDQGVESTFLTTPFAAGVVRRFGEGRVRQIALGAPSALAAQAASLVADAVIFDHYGLSSQLQEAASAGRPSIVIDDLADRPLWADLVVDVGAHRSASDYGSLLPAGAKILAGPVFALIRPEFLAARPEALARRDGRTPRSVLVSMGLTDVGGVTLDVVRAIRGLDPDIQIEVVIGPQAGSLETLKAQRDPNLRFSELGGGMSVRMAAADVAVGAGGVTAWERCVLGLPSLLVVLAENQRPNAAALAAQGASLVCDRQASTFEVDLREGLGLLLGDSRRRLDLSRNSAGLCDGHGAARVAAAISALMKS